MRNIRLYGVALLAMMALAACAEADDTVGDAVTTLPDRNDVAEVAEEIQSQIEAVGTEIENSEAAEQLRSAWDELRTEVMSAVNSVSADEPIDTEAIRAMLDEFQTELEAAGEEVSDEFASAWRSLRAAIEELIR